MDRLPQSAPDQRHPEDHEQKCHSQQVASPRGGREARAAGQSVSRSQSRKIAYYGKRFQIFTKYQSDRGKYNPRMPNYYAPFSTPVDRLRTRQDRREMTALHPRGQPEQPPILQRLVRALQQAGEEAGFLRRPRRLRRLFAGPDLCLLLARLEIEPFVQAHAGRGGALGQRSGPDIRRIPGCRATARRRPRRSAHAMPHLRRV